MATCSQTRNTQSPRALVISNILHHWLTYLIIVYYCPSHSDKSIWSKQMFFWCVRWCISSAWPSVWHLTGAQQKFVDKWVAYSCKEDYDDFSWMTYIFIISFFVLFTYLYASANILVKENEWTEGRTHGEDCLKVVKLLNFLGHPIAAPTN